MKRPTVGARIRAAVAKASPQQRHIAKLLATDIAKAPDPAARAFAVIQWLRALGQNPKDWSTFR